MLFSLAKTQNELKLTSTIVSAAFFAMTVLKLFDVYLHFHQHRALTHEMSEVT